MGPTKIRQQMVCKEQANFPGGLVKPCLMCSLSSTPAPAPARRGNGGGGVITRQEPPPPSVARCCIQPLFCFLLFRAGPFAEVPELRAWLFSEVVHVECLVGAGEGLPPYLTGEGSGRCLNSSVLVFPKKTQMERPPSPNSTCKGGPSTVGVNQKDTQAQPRIFGIAGSHQGPAQPTQKPHDCRARPACLSKLSTCRPANLLSGLYVVTG